MSQLRRVFVDFPIPEDVSSSTELTLSARDSHHLKNVLRLGCGSEIEIVCIHSSQLFIAQIIAFDPVIRVKIIKRITETSYRSRVTSLAVALCKGKRNDFICEKACELGVENMIFWQAERSVVRISSEKDKYSKTKRFERILEAAAKQSNKNRIPSLYLPLNLNELLDIYQKISEDGDRKFCCSLLSQALEMRELDPPHKAVHLLVGPEGDLTSKEEDVLFKHGFEPITLGPYVLRSDTAALAAIAMAHGLWGYTL